eukprot:2297996-Pyramimonas_sp.AAC.1
MPLDEGQLLAYNDPRRQTGEHSVFGRGNPAYRDAQGRSIRGGHQLATNIRRPEIEAVRAQLRNVIAARKLYRPNAVCGPCSGPFQEHRPGCP